MLEVKNLQVHYGTVEAVRGVSFHVNAGEMVSLIGANGAGKSTILRSLTGLVQPSAGDILFENRSLVNLSPHQIMANAQADDLMRREVHQRAVFKQDVPCAGLHQAGQRAQNGALAGTIGTDETDHLAGVDV